MSDFVWHGKSKARTLLRTRSRLALSLVVLAGGTALATYTTPWAMMSPDAGTASRSEVLGSGYGLADVVNATYSRPEEVRRPKTSAGLQKASLHKRATTCYSSDKCQAGVQKKLNADLGRDYRSMCVRLCDGFYYPISFSVTPDLFWRDERICQSSCTSPARLFVYRNALDSAETMEDLDGNPYSSLGTSYQYRVAYDPNCSCKPQPWSQEAKNVHRVYALEAKLAAGEDGVATELAALKVQVAADQRLARQNADAVVIAYYEEKRDIASVGPAKLAKSKARTAKAAQAAPSRKKAGPAKAVERAKYNAPAAVVQVRAPAPRGLIRPSVASRGVHYVPSDARVRVTQARGLFR